MSVNPSPSPPVKANVIDEKFTYNQNTQKCATGRRQNKYENQKFRLSKSLYFLIFMHNYYTIFEYGFLSTLYCYGRSIASLTLACVFLLEELVVGVDLVLG